METNPVLNPNVPASIAPQLLEINAEKLFIEVPPPLQKRWRRQPHRRLPNWKTALRFAARVLLLFSVRESQQLYREVGPERQALPREVWERTRAREWIR